MKTFEKRPAKSNGDSRNRATDLAAPRVLTPDQVEAVAAGFTRVKGPTTIAGGIPADPSLVRKQ